MGGRATALSMYRIVDVAEQDASTWQHDVDAAASVFPGFVESRVAPPTRAGDDWAVAVTFGDERRLRTWLASPERSELLAAAAARGIHSDAAPVVLVAGEAPPPGVAVFTHSVSPGRQALFVETEGALRDSGRAFPGHLGATLLAPSNPDDDWLSVVRFDTEEHLAAWLASDARGTLLPALRASLTADFGQYTRRVPFASIVRYGADGARVTPDWKTAMVVLLVLFPVVMLLSRFVGPVLADAGADPGVAMWLSQVLSVGLLTYVAMPLATRWLRWWLDPIDGAGTRRTLLGVVLILVLYGLTLGLFESVQWLQFWDFQDD